MNGGTPRDSYVSPWDVTSLKHAGFDAGIGTLRETTVDRIARESTTNLGISQ